MRDRASGELREHVARRCPLCRQAVPLPETLSAAELAGARAGLGVRLGYTDGVPLPVSLFAWLCGVSERSMAYYLADERRVPTRVSARVRELQALNNDDLLARHPHRAQVRKMERIRRKRLWAERKVRRDNGLKDDADGPEPPF